MDCIFTNSLRKIYENPKQGMSIFLNSLTSSKGKIIPLNEIVLTNCQITVTEKKILFSKQFIVPTIMEQFSVKISFHDEREFHIGVFTNGVKDKYHIYYNVSPDELPLGTYIPEKITILP